jgi:hypothetical protein
VTQPLFYWNEKHGKTQTRVIDLTYAISAAKTAAPIVQGQDSLAFFDAITQAQIDAYLGVANDFPVTYFDSTSMGADTFGGLVRMSGITPSGVTPTAAQGFQLAKMEAFCASGTGGSTLVSRYANGTTGMTASTLETACAISTTGNFGFKIDFGNTPDFDALTSGLIVVRLYWISK